MSYRIVIGPRAEKDILDSALWMLKRANSRAKALRASTHLREKIATLATDPLKLPIDPDAIAFGDEVRTLLHGRKSGRQRIHFVVKGDVVHVLAVRLAAGRGLAEEVEAVVEEDDGREPGATLDHSSEGGES